MTLGSKGILTKILIFNTMLACHGPLDRKGLTSGVQGTAPGSPSTTMLTPPGGDYTVGEANSIRAFSQWSPRERALMIIAADNGIYNTQNPMNPRRLPYLKLKSESVSINEYIQKYPNYDPIQHQYKKLSQKFSSDGCQGDTLIPYHPDTKSQHRRIDLLKKQDKVLQGDKKYYSDLVGFSSMSRSLFVLNEKSTEDLPLLFSLKVGSDTVMGSNQPDKLYGVYWNAKYVNSLSQPTSIHELAEANGIAFLSDSVGLVYDRDYGVVLRDYNLLINEKDYFFMPLMAFQEKAIEKKSPSGEVDSYMWNLYKPASAQIFAKNEKILRLIVSKPQIKKIVDELSQEMGKLIAIYYLNGISSLDLHGQNLMVGIPLNPERQAMIAVRDTSDHWVFPYARTDFIQMKYGAIPEPKWCQPLFRSPGAAAEACSKKVQQLTLKGFEAMAKNLEFKFQDTDFQKFKSTNDIYALLEKNNAYQDQIIRVRTQFKALNSLVAKPRVQTLRCLRSTGCPYMRARAIP